MSSATARAITLVLALVAGVGLLIAISLRPDQSLIVPSLLAFSGVVIASLAAPLFVREADLQSDDSIRWLKTQGVVILICACALVGVMFVHSSTATSSNELKPLIVAVDKPVAPQPAAVDGSSHEIERLREEVGDLSRIIRALAMRDHERATRHQTTHNDMSVDPETEAQVRSLRLQLNAERWEDRADAAYELAVLSTDARSASVDLLAALADPKPDVRIAAAEALRSVGADASSVDVLIEMLEENRRSVRMFAIVALTDMGPIALPALPELERMASAADDPGIKLKANEAVRRIRGY